MVFPKQMLLASTAVIVVAVAGLIAPAGAQTAPSSAPPAAAEQPASAQTPPTQAAPSGDADSDIVVTGIPAACAARSRSSERPMPWST